MRQVRLLEVEDRGKALALEGENIETIVCFAAGRIAHDVDQPVERVQAAEQIVVLAVGAREERGEMAEADALEARGPVEPLERVDVLRADAVDQDLVELPEPPPYRSPACGEGAVLVTGKVSTSQNGNPR